MPKIAQDRMEENQRHIEAAALGLFTRQGFHGTNIRDIARKAGVSTGAIYTYYPTKEALYLSVVRNYEARMKVQRDRMFDSLRAPFSEDDLRALAGEIRSMVYDNPEYWLLMYIDVIEFSNQHFAKAFGDMPQQFRRRLGPVLQRAAREPGWCGMDPAFVFATVYQYVITYFLIERLFQGKRHLGVPDERAIEGMIRLLSGGLWAKPAAERVRRLPARSNNNQKRSNGKPRAAAISA